ncbi:AMP-binding protein [Streptomyces sp. NPDC006641]|uniref:AMP-binding protein n=1 Tax=unclassified Streptomyces TaxID=2593676 RepID=UPI0036CEBEF8
MAPPLEHALEPGDFVAVLGPTSAEYTVVDPACARSGAVSVPLQAGAPAEHLAPMAEQTGPRLLVVHIDHLEVAVEPAEQLMEELREKVMGGRLLWAANASAPPSAETTAFVEDCLRVRLLDGYGSTEGGIVSLGGRVLRPPVTDHKPADVPELGYFGTDSPYPRGELLIKSDRLVPGYFRRPDATTEVFDEDGFYRTGDIMARVGPDELRYVDRRPKVLKLSQGEFVTVSRLEALFNGTPGVRQIFLYGNSARAPLLAVVVPTEDALDRAAGDARRLRAILREPLRELAAEAGLNSYEIPRDLHLLVESEPFTQENGLLS